MSGSLVARFEKRFPGAPPIQVQLTAPAAGFSTTVLFGPSGCGKTTILRVLAGLERPESGVITYQNQVWFDAEKSICLPPQERGIGFCFQEYALFPHLTVGENVGYGLHRQDPRRRQTIAEMLERFQLTGLEDRTPQQISGGQQQRVALARALARRPRLLLLDEPLSALDTALREELRMTLRRLLNDFQIPVVLVTHDRVEALALADQVVVMHGGQIEQSGPIESVFSRPKNSAVARMVGIETIEAGQIVEVSDGLATVDVRGVTLIAVAPPDVDRKVHVCIKGEDVTLQKGTHGAQSSRNHLDATVRWITPEGPLFRVGVDCGFELTALVTRPACEELELRPGDRMIVSIKAPAIHLIPRRETQPAV